MDGTGLDPTAARAQAGHVQLTARARFARWCAALPRNLRTYSPWAMLIGGCIGNAIWETVNTYFGFSRWWPERGAFVIVVAVGCNALLITAWRLAAETWRAKKNPAGALGYSALAAMLAGVIMLGLLSNFIAETAVGTQQARELNQARDNLRGSIARVERELLSLPVPMTMDSDRELLTERLAEARGWGMANLDAVAPKEAAPDYPGPSCVADLKARQRFLCNEAIAIRDSLRKGEEMLKARAGKEGDLVTMREKLDKMEIAQRGLQYDRMSKMIGGVIDPDAISDWLLFIVSAVLLLVNCAFIDHLLERRERKEA